MSRLYYHSGGGVWPNVADGDRVRYWNGSGYPVASEARYWNGSTYVSFWKRSNPITLSFFPSFTTSIRRDGGVVEYDPLNSSADNTKADMGMGRYGGSSPYHLTSIMQFRGDSFHNLGTLNANLAQRPYVKSASIRLNRDRGGLVAPAGVIRFGHWTQPFAEFLPATNLTGQYHDWNPQSVYDIYGWYRGWNREFGLHTQLIYDITLNGGSLMFSEVTSGYTVSGGTTSAYGIIYGLHGGDWNRLPVLTVTLDVA